MEPIPDLSLGFCKGCDKIVGRCNCELRKQTGFLNRESWLTYKPVMLLEKVKVPLPIVHGNYEALSDEEIIEHMKDINADIKRRIDAGHDLNFDSYVA